MGLFGSKHLGVGDAAPDFSLTSQRGEAISLRALLAERRAVVLYFYPKDNTPVCTRESCAFRDQYEVFTDAGAEVIGVSRDSTASHEDFAGRHRLPFLLLSDPDGEVHARYGVSANPLGGRVTFVIDAAGVIRCAFSSPLRAGKHVTEALAVVRALA